MSWLTPPHKVFTFIQLFNAVAQSFVLSERMWHFRRWVFMASVLPDQHNTSRPTTSRNHVNSTHWPRRMPNKLPQTIVDMMTGHHSMTSFEITAGTFLPKNHPSVSFVNMASNGAWISKIWTSRTGSSIVMVNLPSFRILSGCLHFKPNILAWDCKTPKTVTNHLSH